MAEKLRIRFRACREAGIIFCERHDPLGRQPNDVLRYGDKDSRGRLITPLFEFLSEEHLRQWDEAAAALGWEPRDGRR